MLVVEWATGEHVGAEMRNLLEEENLSQTLPTLPASSPEALSAGAIAVAN